MTQPSSSQRIPVQPAGPFPPGYFPPPQRKKRVWPWVLGGIGVLLVLTFAGCVALIGSAANELAKSTTVPGQPPASQPAAGQATVGLNTAVRDGKFEFTVTAVQPGPARIGTDVLGATAQGQFVLVHLSVRNIGDVAQTFDGGSQKLFDAPGREFSADSAAAIYLDESQSFLNEINPGNAVAGIVVFDIPRDVQPVRVELHDSPFSGGVSVTLG